MGALALSIRKQFNQFLTPYWQFFEHAMKKDMNASKGLIRGAMASISDICTAIEEGFVAKISVIDTLLASLNNVLVDKEVKLTIFTTLGDVVLACKD